MDDPRNQSYIIYTQADLTYMAILKNICGQHSMREMEENFNKETCIDTLRIMSENQHMIRFQWVTSLELTKRKLEEMIHAGRDRWKIENEGFNNQKNGL